MDTLATVKIFYVKDNGILEFIGYSNNSGIAVAQPVYIPVIEAASIASCGYTSTGGILVYQIVLA